MTLVQQISIVQDRTEFALLWHRSFLAFLLCVPSLRSFSAFLLCVSSFQLCPCFVKLNHKNLTRRLPEIRSRRTHEPKPTAQKEDMMRGTGLPYRPADAPE